LLAEPHTHTIATAYKLLRIEGHLQKLVIGLILALGAIWFLGGTAAAAPTTTTLVLTCDPATGGVSATVDLCTASPFVGGTVFDTVSLSCGPDSISGLKTERLKVTTRDAGWYNLSSFTYQNAQGAGGCPGAGTVPAKVSCPADGSSPGATLVIR
jgi:hypothetical protein